MPSEFSDATDSGIEGDPSGDFHKISDKEAEELRKEEDEEFRKKEEEERKLKEEEERQKKLEEERKAKRKRNLSKLIKKSNVEALRQEALSEGLLDDDVRSKAWPLLLGLKGLPDWENISGEELENHPEYHQVVLDVNRSIKRFPPSIQDRKREAIEKKLIATIVTILSRNPGLHYYQGFHDVAVTILLIVNSKVAGHIIEKLSTEHLKPFLEKTMDRTGRLLEYIYPLLEKIDYDLFKHLDSSNVGTVFCLPWFITWFSHTLEVYDTLMRLFDYFLAYDHKPENEFLLPLYLIVCIIHHWRDEVLKVECDMSEMHAFFYSKPLDTLDFEELLKKADNYYKTYPPEELKEAVEKRIREKEERLKREEIERKAARERRLRPKPRKTQWVRLTALSIAGVVILLSSMYLVRDSADLEFFTESILPLDIA